MKDKLAHWAQGAIAGVVVALVVGLSTGWLVTKGTAAAQAEKKLASFVVWTCATQMLANPASVAVLKTKEIRDYDDAVRDSWVAELPKDVEAPTNWGFRRECGEAIAAMMAAPKS